jgi:hypothetical protein
MSKSIRTGTEIKVQSIGAEMAETVFNQWEQGQFNFKPIPAGGGGVSFLEWVQPIRAEVAAFNR